MTQNTTDTDKDHKGERIAKVIARAGICSRRDAEARITEGRVKVNGKTIDTPATLVTSDDVIVVDGKPLPMVEPPRLWRFHKPTGLVTTHKDPEGRPTVFDRLPKSMPRVISVGRLDLNSEGLLLLTNDGELARKLELPSNGWTRKYRVRVFGRLRDADLERLAKGMTVDGVRYGPVMAKVDRQQGANTWLEVTLTEGKNREIRRLMEALGVSVNRLIRVAYGPFALGNLPVGAAEELPPKTLKETLGAAVKDKLPSQATVSRERKLRERAGLSPSAEAKPKSAVEAPKKHIQKRKPKPHHFGDDEAPRRGKPVNRGQSKPRAAKPSKS